MVSNNQNRRDPDIELQLPPGVSELLQLRKRSADLVPGSPKQNRITEFSQNFSPRIRKLPGGAMAGDAHATPLMYAFQCEVESLGKQLEDETQHRGSLLQSGPSGVELRSYFDLRDYDLSKIEGKKHDRPPASLRMIYMFYARLYDKLLGKQLGKDVKLMASGKTLDWEFDDAEVVHVEMAPPMEGFPGAKRKVVKRTCHPRVIDIGQQRVFGFREILDFAKDFDFRPKKIGIRDLERCYFEAIEIEDQDEAFNSGLNYREFIRFLIFMADIIQSSSRGELKEDNVGLFRAVKNMSNSLNLSSSKHVKSTLIDIWRDNHFTRLREDEDFTKTARMMKIKCVPKHRVRPIHESIRTSTALPTCVAWLTRYTYLDNQPLWEAFPLPYIDMGTSYVGQSAKHFKLVVSNRVSHLMTFRVRAEGCGPMRVPLSEEAMNVGIPCGSSVSILVEPSAREPGEFAGRLHLRCETTAGECFDVTIPIYQNFILPDANVTRPLRNSNADVDSSDDDDHGGLERRVISSDITRDLPFFAPRPFVELNSAQIEVAPNKNSVTMKNKLSVVRSPVESQVSPPTSIVRNEDSSVDSEIHADFDQVMDATARLSYNDRIGSARPQSGRPRSAENNSPARISDDGQPDGEREASKSVVLRPSEVAPPGSRNGSRGSGVLRQSVLVDPANQGTLYRPIHREVIIDHQSVHNLTSRTPNRYGQRSS